jgi:hypothetical protein
MIGPIIIVGRPRSGSRVLARLLRENGVFMGAYLDSMSLDSVSWHQRFVAPLMTNRFFPNLCSVEMQRFAKEQLDVTWPHYSESWIAGTPWGWKVCETLFLIPIIRRFFSTARFIHIIRDARDVCISNRGFFQLTQPSVPRDWCSEASDEGARKFHDFCIASTFGELGIRKWRGLDLTCPSGLSSHRFLIQARSWVTCVEQAQIYGQTLGEDYYELRYEDLCLDPMVATRRLFAWLKLPLLQLSEIRSDRLNRWQNTSLSTREKNDFDDAIELSSPLLRKLGYVY